MAPKLRTTQSRAAKLTTVPTTETSASTPSEIASAGYPNKDASVTKGKPIPQGLHFTKNAENTYTGSTVKAHAPNSFAPLTVHHDTSFTLEVDDDPHTAEYLLALDMNEVDLVSDDATSEIEYIESPASATSMATITPATATSTPKGPSDPVKLLARRLGRGSSTPASLPADTPFSALVATAMSAIDAGTPFLTPTVPDAPQTSTSDNATEHTTIDKGKGRALPENEPEETALAIPAAPAPEPSDVPANEPTLPSAVPQASTTTIQTAPATDVETPAPTIQHSSAPAVISASALTPTASAGNATTLPATAAPAPTANANDSAPTQAPTPSFASVAAAAPSARVTRSAARIAAAAAFPGRPSQAGPSMATAIPSMTTAANNTTAPGATTLPSAPPAAPGPPLVLPPPAPLAQAAALPPPAPPAVPPPAPSAANPGAPQPPVITGAAAQVAGATATVWLPVPAGGFPPVYGWDDLKVFMNILESQVVRWQAAPNEKIFIYAYDGQRFDPNGTALESLKTAVSRVLGGHAPLIGPSSPTPSTTSRASPFLYLVRNISAAQSQRLLSHPCWATTDTQFFTLPFAPPPSPFLGSIYGLTFSATQEHAVEVATLVAVTIRDNQVAQSFLATVNDNYPAGTDPMAHFIASIRVSPVNRAPSGARPILIWNVTADPPSLITASNRAWVQIFEGLEFDSDMFFIGKVIKPALFCYGCKSLGHQRDFCPFRAIPGWPTHPAPAAEDQNTSNRRNGNNGGNNNGGGKGGKKGNGNGRRPRKMQRTD